MIVLGRVTAPYGVKGWLRLHPFGDDPASWRTMKRWWLGHDDKEFNGWNAYSLQGMRMQGRAWVVKLAGVDDRDAAEALVGQFVGAPRSDMPVTEDGEYYWADLVGLKVINQQQEVLGCVTELVETGAHAVMVVRAGEGDRSVERLLPFVGQVVMDVNVAEGEIIVDWGSDW